MRHHASRLWKSGATSRPCRYYRRKPRRYNDHGQPTTLTRFPDWFIVLPAAALLASAGAVCCVAAAQQPGSPVSGGVILLDPAHGGPDSGAHLTNGSLEKDVVLALAGRIRTSLAGAGFTVVSTREGDSSAALSPDQRAELANHARALACLIIHATSTGSGAHLFVSSLPPTVQATSSAIDKRPPFAPVPWSRAQAGFVDQSARLRKDLATYLASNQVPALTGFASTPPLDNLQCPAIAIELAPLGDPGSDRTPVSDAAYQQRVADGVVSALKAWRNESEQVPAEQTQPAGDAH